MSVGDNAPILFRRLTVFVVLGERIVGKKLFQLFVEEFFQRFCIGVYLRVHLKVSIIECTQFKTLSTYWIERVGVIEHEPYVFDKLIYTFVMDFAGPVEFLSDNIESDRFFDNFMIFHVLKKIT